MSSHRTYTLQWCILLISAIVFIANAAQENPVQGRVVDNKGSPVEGVEICFFDSDLKVVNNRINSFTSYALKCVKSDNYGFYPISSLQQKAFTIIGRKKDFWFIHKNAFEDESIVDTIKPCGGIHFFVKLEKAQRHDNISVSLTGTPFSSKSDRSGAVLLTDLPTGTYIALLKASKPGYLDVQCSLHIAQAVIDTFPDTLVLSLTEVKPVLSSGLTEPIKTIGTDTVPKHNPEKKEPENITQTIQNSTPEIDTPKIIEKPPVPPIVNAGKDTVANLRDEITLHGTAHVNDGDIVSMEWAIGPMPFRKVQDGTIHINAPAIVSAPLACVFRATSDKGLQATDTVIVKARSSPPVITIKGDSITGIFDSIHLTASARDNGTIVSMGWDIGNTGKFAYSSNGSITIPPQRVPVNTLACVFRAIDDDGEATLDTARIRIIVKWKTITPNPSIPERKGHTMVSFNGKLWIIGGNRSDIWNSEDGIQWQKVTESAPFGQRFGHSATAFNGLLFVIGGKASEDKYTNDIWSSSDGKNWQKVLEADFLKRHYHTVTQFENRLWLIGGLGEAGYESCLNDIWSTEDGTHWKPEKDTSLFSRRYAHGTVQSGNSLIIAGGIYENLSGTEVLRDIWQSKDGINWKPLTDSLPSNESEFNALLEFENQSWIIGGYCKTCSETDRFTNLGYSTNNGKWVSLNKAGQSAGSRRFCAAAVFNNHIFVSPSDSPQLYMLQ